MIRPLALLLLSPVLALAVDIPAYTVRLRTEADGSGRAVATVTLTGCQPGTLNLPLGFTALEDLRLEEAPAGTKIEQGPRKGMTLLNLQLPLGTPAQTTLRFSFRLRQVFLPNLPKPGEKSNLPAGSRIFRHGFVNTQEATIGAYRLEYLLPEGFMAQAIREQLPKPAKSEVEPRVVLSKVDGRQSATLKLSSLQQGDDTSMVLEVVPVRRSLGWLVAGLLLGGLYLFYFRDLVARPKA